jgi:hypothetical protein
MKRCTAFCFMFLATSAIAGMALAGIYGESVEYTSKNPDKQTVTKMYIDDSKLRIEQPGEKDTTIFIYRGDKNLVWIIKPAEKLYQEITEQDIQNMKAQMEQAGKMMEEQMKNLPPEQREQMEKLMAKMPQAQTEEKKEVVYKLVGKNEKVGDYTCEHYAALEDGKKTWDLWTVDYKDVPVSAQDLAPLEALGEFFGQMGGSDAERYLIGTQEPLKGDEGPRFHGMPVKWTDVEADSVVRVNELKTLDKQTVDASLFDVPKGLKKTEKPLSPGDE